MVLVPRELPEYYYSDLPEETPHIRLLRLRPGKREDYINAHLFPISLHDAYRKYECKFNLNFVPLGPSARCLDQLIKVLTMTPIIYFVDKLIGIRYFVRLGR